MVFRKFFKNVKNPFNKLKNLSKKIRDKRKELFKILTKLQNNLQKQKFIAEELCKESTYRIILGNNLSEEFCELQGIIDSMLNLVYQERVRISKEIGLLDKVLKIYDEEKMKNINNPQVFNQIRSHEMAIAKALQSAYNSEYVGEKIIDHIINLYTQKKRNINAIKGFARNNIKNSVINKKIKELISLTKEEEKLLSKIKGEELKEKIELKEEMMALKALENFNVLREHELQQMQHEIEVKEKNLTEEQNKLKTDIKNLKNILENFLRNVNEIINNAKELESIINKLRKLKKFAKTVGKLSNDVNKLINDAQELRNNISELIELINNWSSSIMRWLNESRNNTTNQSILRSAIENLGKIKEEINKAENILRNIERYLGEINNDISKIIETINEISDKNTRDKLNKIVEKIRSSINGVRGIIGNIRDLMNRLNNGIEITIKILNGILSIIEFFRRLFSNPNQGQTYTNIR